VDGGTEGFPGVDQVLCSVVIAEEFGERGEAAIGGECAPGKKTVLARGKQEGVGGQSADLTVAIVDDAAQIDQNKRGCRVADPGGIEIGVLGRPALFGGFLEGQGGGGIVFISRLKPGAFSVGVGRKDKRMECGR